MRQIAIIDDDPQSLEGMREVIPWSKMDCEWVGEAQDGKAGLELIRSLNPDIVITDVYMPVMNGLTMIEHLREGDFKGKIIILSGYSDFEYARKALRLQVDDYLSKPVTVEEIVNVLEKSIDELDEEAVNEINEQEMRKKLMLFEPFVISEWIKSVVAGTYVSHQIHESVIESLQKSWDSFHHQVMGIKIIEPHRPDLKTYSDLSLFRFAVYNLIQEIAAEVWPHSEVVELRGRYLALLLHIQATNETASMNVQNRIEALCDRIRMSAKQYLDLNLGIGLGRVKTSWQQISTSAEEAFHAISAEQTADADGIAMNTLSFKMNQQLSEALLQEDSSLAEQLVTKFSEAIHLKKNSEAWQVHSIAKDLWSTVSYSLFLGGEPVDHLYQQSAIYQEIQSLQSPQELKAWIHQKIIPICTNARKRSGFKHKKTVDFMMQYAHQHYAQDITLDDLSAKLYLSRNYLNKIFKQAIGETFTSYVTRVRMEKAKALIAEGKYLIYEIAEMVGYKNIPYFSARFKKHFGVNPSDL